ncbi:hypothetical protein HAX54_015312, partial [Datura stramonium]|nr:hypothetical protein [Datura stramonium]
DPEANRSMVHCYNIIVLSVSNLEHDGSNFRNGPHLLSLWSNMIISGLLHCQKRVKCEFTLAAGLCGCGTWFCQSTPASSAIVKRPVMRST